MPGIAFKSNEKHRKCVVAVVRPFLLEKREVACVRERDPGGMNSDDCTSFEGKFGKTKESSDFIKQGMQKKNGFHVAFLGFVRLLGEKKYCVKFFIIFPSL